MLGKREKHPPGTSSGAHLQVLLSGAILNGVSLQMDRLGRHSRSPPHRRELREQKKIDLRMGHELGGGSRLTVTLPDISSARSTLISCFLRQHHLFQTTFSKA